MWITRHSQKCRYGIGWIEQQYGRSTYSMITTKSSKFFAEPCLRPGEKTPSCPVTKREGSTESE
jgi:hypothetical protein